MITKQFETIDTFLDSKKHILLVLPQNTTFDELLGAQVLSELLGKKDIPSKIVRSQKIDTKSLKFLETTFETYNSIPHLTHTAITIDPPQGVELDVHSKTLPNGTIEISITPELGRLTTAHCDIRESQYQYDLIICINTPSLSSLGSIFSENASFFYETDIIHITNHNFSLPETLSTISDHRASSISEIIYRLVYELAPEFLNKTTAEKLLTGMVAATHGFKQGTIRPASLFVASKLMELGADRKKIVTNLYQTRALSTLRLWGRILSRITMEKNAPVLHAIISTEDLYETGAQTQHIADVIPELLLNSPEAQTIVLTYSTKIPNTFESIIYSVAGNAHLYTKNFTSTGTEIQSTVTLQHHSIQAAHEMIINQMK